LTEALRAGELSSLPLETVVTLAQRRAQETKKSAWVEGHHGAGVRRPEVSIHVQRRNPKKDKFKRKDQQQSRRRNRGK